VSPYFSTAVCNTGESLRRLGEFYAVAIARAGIGCDIYGRYKGILLVAATAALAACYGRDMPHCFNRGGRGPRRGGPPSRRWRVGPIVDDDHRGTSVRESINIIRAGAAPVASSSRWTGASVALRQAQDAVSGSGLGCRRSSTHTASPSPAS
jgi:orotate phosphoribosyltransferase